MKIPRLPVRRATRRSESAIGAGVLAIAILMVSTAAYSTEPDSLFVAGVACSSEPEAPVATAVACSTEPAAPDATAAALSAEPDVLTVEPEPRSLFLAAEWKVWREDPSQQSVMVAARVEGLTSLSTGRRVRLTSPGRAWPFALAATADAATTYWALAHGGSERNPLLAFGRVDVGMVKIIQFPLLAKAVDRIEARHPRLGRRLRWTTLVFHAVLAINNVRLGRAAGERGLDAQRRARP